MSGETIKEKDRDALLQSLRAGVVPRKGQHLIQVGRGDEIRAFVHDIDRIGDGGSSFRLVVGEYGSGKSFFLNLVESIALEKKLVVVYADLNPNRRLQSTGGQARSLYAELMKNMSTRTRPDGGALSGIVEKFISHAVCQCQKSDEAPLDWIRTRLEPLTELLNGYDFCEVIMAYYRGFEQGNEPLKQDSIKWLRGEFVSKIEARQSLGVRTIIDDASVYDMLKLFSRFLRIAGYGGLYVCLDEMVNIYKLSHAQTRNANYEQILRILNDCLQGGSAGLGFLMAGTPDFLTNTSRGLYSYEALKGRLALNEFAKDGLVDRSGPVVWLAGLGNEEYYVLMKKIVHVYARGDAEKYLLTDQEVLSFLENCNRKLGSQKFRTPRQMIVSLINLLAVLEQNPGTSAGALLGHVDVATDEGPDNSDIVDDDPELEMFRVTA